MPQPASASWRGPDEHARSPCAEHPDAPLIGGIYGANGSAVSFASNLHAHTADLFDVASGSNGTCRPAYFCHAEIGYDVHTGLGTPNAIGAFGD